MMNKKITYLLAFNSLIIPATLSPSAAPTAEQRIADFVPLITQAIQKEEIKALDEAMRLLKKTYNHQTNDPIIMDNPKEAGKLYFYPLLYAASQLKPVAIAYFLTEKSDQLLKQPITPMQNALKASLKVEYTSPEFINACYAIGLLTNVGGKDFNITKTLAGHVLQQRDFLKALELQLVRIPPMQTLSLQMKGGVELTPEQNKNVETFMATVQAGYEKINLDRITTSHRKSCKTCVAKSPTSDQKDMKEKATVAGSGTAAAPAATTLTASAAAPATACATTSSAQPAPATAKEKKKQKKKK